MNLIYFIKDIFFNIYFILLQIIIFIAISFYNIAPENISPKEYKQYNTLYTSLKKKTENTSNNCIEWYTKKYNTQWYIEPYTIESISYKILMTQLIIVFFIAMLLYIFHLLKPFFKKKHIKISTYFKTYSVLYFYIFLYETSPNIKNYKFDLKHNNEYFSYEYFIDSLLYLQIKTIILLICIFCFIHINMKLIYRVMCYVLIIYIFSFDLFIILYFIILSELCIITINIFKYWR